MGLTIFLAIKGIVELWKMGSDTNLSMGYILVDVTRGKGWGKVNGRNLVAHLGEISFYIIRLSDPILLG